jgi:hypothetical protein
MKAIPACRYLRPMQAAPLTEIECEVIDDILAVCRRCGWPTRLRPSLRAYLSQSGYVYHKQIKRLGGWTRLCALAGMHVRGGRRPVLRDVNPAMAGEDDIVADVRAVAQSLHVKPGCPLTYAEYFRGGGAYGKSAISKAGGWATLSAAAGYPSGLGTARRATRHEWKKTKPALTGREFDAALNAAVGHTPIRRGFLCLVKGRPRGRRGPKTVYRQVPALERGEIIADIREIALSAGLDSPRLLTFATYRAHGGRYTFDQAATFGGFDTLRRAA